MIKTDIPTRQAVSEITKAYRLQQSDTARPVGLRKFAELLSVDLQNGYTISHQSINNWVNSKHMPQKLLITILATKLGWVGDFGKDILSVMNPDSNFPTTEIGAKARRNLMNKIIPMTYRQTFRCHVCRYRFITMPRFLSHDCDAIMKRRQIDDLYHNWNDERTKLWIEKQKRIL